MRLERYEDDWDPDDPHANFKREVSEYTRADPLPTMEALSELTGVPPGAIARYALVRWTAEGSEAMLSLGPAEVDRLWAFVDEAERQDSDEARLAAYHALRQRLAWLRAPTEQANEVS